MWWPILKPLLQRGTVQRAEQPNENVFREEEENSAVEAEAADQKEATPAEGSQQAGPVSRGQVKCA